MRKTLKLQKKKPQRHSLHNHNSRATAVLLVPLIDQLTTNVIIKNFQLITYNLFNFSFRFSGGSEFVSWFPSKWRCHEAMMF